MTPRPHVVLAALCAGLGLVVAGAAAADTPVGADTRREVLVMLRLPPAHLRPTVDYGGSYDDGLGRSARRRIAGRLARENGLTLVDDWPMPLIGVDCFVLAAPPDRSPRDIAARLSHDPEVAWSEPVSLYRAEGPAPTHNDPLYAAQPAAREWRLAALHLTSTGRNVRVAVVDSMVETTHPDLAGQVETSRNFVAGRGGDAAEQHGTAVAGIIAAVADNHIGIAGVAPHARLLALRACWQRSASETVCDSLSLAKALDFAINHGAQVINLSLAGPNDLLLGKLLDVAEAKSIVVVIAADPSLPDGGFPASHRGVIAVAAEGASARRSDVYSAPGLDVPTTTPGGHWGLVSGNSFAAAHVSGLFALLRERRPAGSPPLKLAVARPGGVVDACASLLGASEVCGDGTVREAAASPR